MNQTMYEQNVYFPDPFKGCKHDCIYCKPSFQKQAKRQKQRCGKCYTFEPHFHIERLAHSSPKTKENQFVFFPKGGDIAFASEYELWCMLQYVKDNPQTTFLMQTKDPTCLLKREHYPDNLILGVTLETDKDAFGVPIKEGGLNPTNYVMYKQISKAPIPFERTQTFIQVKHKRKSVTIEPILFFSPLFIAIIQAIEPEFVYVGYDTKNCHLPEPTLTKTKKLISELSVFTEVREKTLREAWWYPLS